MNLFGQRTVGSGVYLQQYTADGERMRWEMTWQLGERAINLVQVADGTYLWVHSSLTDPALTRIDTRQAGGPLGSPGAAGGAAASTNMGLIGGLARLLRSLEAAFDFDVAEPGRWGQQKQPVWRLRGSWKPRQLAEFLPKQREAILAGEAIDPAQLPEQIPATAVLLLGQEDLFPYRIEYRRPAGDGSPDADPLGRLLVATDFYEVNINVPIEPARFLYNPGNMPFADGTEAFRRSVPGRILPIE